MQLAVRLISAALALLPGAPICLAAPQLQNNNLNTREDGVDLLIQIFPDLNCGVSLEENKFHLDPVAAVNVSKPLCIENISNAGSIRMVEQPYQEFICTYVTWSGSDCRGDSSKVKAGDECRTNLPFASFSVTCPRIVA